MDIVPIYPHYFMINKKSPVQYFSWSKQA